ncbi:MAG TPA: hypothetical protein VH643_13090 [Gemmataceae bacterium]|jgi:hypothetical protein
MDHSNDPPPIDARRLARWTAHPPNRRDRRRSDLASPRTVIQAHGGEVTFWLAWLRGELDDDLQAWFRHQAEKDAELRQDLRSIEQPHGAGYSTRSARAELRNALEAVNYLTENHGGDPAARPALLAFEEVQTETDLALTVQSSGRKDTPAREANQAELRRRIRSSLFALLEEVEIHVPAADEVSEGTLLLEHLVGLPAVSKFHQLCHLQARGVCAGAALRDRLLRAMAPDLFAHDGTHFRNRLSFRLFLRSRLQHYCRRRGWLPVGPRYRDLPSAFAALSRERIGALVRGMLSAHDVFQAAGVPCPQLAVLLESAP